MGYRNYLNRLPKSTYLEVKDLTEHELCKLYGDYDEHENGEIEAWFSERDLPGFEELYELGKYCEFKIDGVKSRFWTHRMSGEDDCEFSLGSKELVLQIIDEYRQAVFEGYEKFSKETNLELIHKEMVNKAREWREDYPPYNIDENTTKLVNSWKYEYEVFELVKLLKNFDWENDVLIYNGY